MAYHCNGFVSFICHVLNRQSGSWRCHDTEHPAPGIGLLKDTLVLHTCLQVSASACRIWCVTSSSHDVMMTSKAALT